MAHKITKNRRIAVKKCEKNNKPLCLAGCMMPDGLRRPCFCGGAELRRPVRDAFAFAILTTRGVVARSMSKKRKTEEFSVEIVFAAKIFKNG